jgi:type VI secretion system secreted protein VgrG
VYQLHLAPSFWALSQSHHSRVFTNKTVPEIIEAVLSEAGLTSFELALQGSYPTREHVCQYHESDFAFVSRWMEREGMYYYFDHSGDEDKLVIADHLSNHEKSREEAVRYRPLSAQDTSSGEAFYRFRSASVLLPGSVKLTDYNYLTPDVDVLGENAVLDKGRALVVDHGVNVDAPGEGARPGHQRSLGLQVRCR